MADHKSSPAQRTGSKWALRSALLCQVLLPGIALAQTYSGPAEVVDGDSLSVSGLAVRLFGIDAPEGTQLCRRSGSSWPCGEEAATQLRNMIGPNPIECRGRGIDAFGRSVAVCTVAGVELNQAMVEAGWATAFRKYAQDYVVAETRARAARRGIWDSEFELPEAYRAARQRPEEPASRTAVRELDGRRGSPARSSECVI